LNLTVKILHILIRPFLSRAHSEKNQQQPEIILQND